MANRLKDWYTESDSARPYRVTCPKFSITTQRFDCISKARTAFDYCRSLGHQAILSKIDFQFKETKIIDYSPNN